MDRLAILAALALLIACSSDAPPPTTKAPEITPEVAAAPGRIYLSDGKVLGADDWWDSGDLLATRSSYHGGAALRPGTRGKRC